MVKSGSVEHRFSHSWPTVVHAYLTKYPTPYEARVLSVDVIDEKYDSERQITYTKRRFTSSNTAPWLIRKMLGAPHLHWVEDLERDDKNWVLKCRTVNETFSSVVQCEENSSYTCDPSDPSSRTIFRQTGFIHAHGLGVLNGPCETFAGFCMEDGAKKAIKLLDMKLAGLLDVLPEATFTGDDVIFTARNA
eukprot:CAMPEP_0184675744 /NCGR_PEP_ID=MMETSP0308-20130426/87957_1 /TAXON_ID=38269 /ORGANISM="Gloeochaete witrockiana, Strain SAG 46.84" /LENGTH=190 /DNA_ID=CAMNT_0027123485 /DNA_START=153 /DNA_END=725 /DNA_ORIENTATION=+